MNLTKCPLTGIHTAQYGDSIASARSAEQAANLCLAEHWKMRPALYLVG